ncbi:MAG: hypothetical protein ACI4QR_06745 [Eubacteriales bacterium]
MKNNEEFRRAVFEKAEAYEKNRKERRQRGIRMASAFLSCAVFALIVSMVPLHFLVRNSKTEGAIPTLASVSTIEVNTTGQYAETGTGYIDSTQMGTTMQETTTTMLYTTSAATFATSCATSLTQCPFVINADGAYAVKKDVFSGDGIPSGTLFASYSEFNKNVSSYEASFFTEQTFESSYIVYILFNCPESIFSVSCEMFSLEKGKSAEFSLKYTYTGEEKIENASFALLIPVDKDDFNGDEKITVEIIGQNEQDDN